MASYSSADFWRVPPELKADIPERLHHPKVTGGLSDGSQKFSSDRGHEVHIVNLPSKTISMTIGVLEPGKSTRLHRHNYETVIYVVAGEGFSRIGDRIVEWSAGDAVYIPIWAAHQHVSTLDSGECIYVACENAPLLQNLGGLALRQELGAASGANSQLVANRI
jgi:pyrroloquinoline-quinone synthase